jgi:hypothetical protein
MREKGAERELYVSVSNAAIALQSILSGSTFPKHKSREMICSEIRKSDLTLHPIEKVTI